MIHIPNVLSVTREAVLPISLPIVSMSVDARRDIDPISAEDSWESEGGSLSRSADAGRLAGAPVSTSGELASLTAQIDLMASVLSGDFIDGRVGTRYNTYAHRSRVLRQQRAKLDAMCARWADRRNRDEKFSSH